MFCSLYMAVRIGRGLPKKAARLQRKVSETSSENEALAVIATTDPLTGVSNRLYGETMLRRMLVAQESCGGKLAIALVDLDHFKSLNDEFGHAVGDSVLRRVAHLLGRGLRSSDTVSRYGGEEFLILMPGASGPAGFLILDTIRGNLEEAEWDHRAITFSAGVIECDGRLSPEAVLAQADKALYTAKAQGRNQVVLATEEFLESA
jgi:diguanylate cyclase (GGDEF)-like protein